MQRKEVGFVDPFVELKYGGVVKVRSFDKLAHFRNHGPRQVTGCGHRKNTALGCLSQ